MKTWAVEVKEYLTSQTVNPEKLEKLIIFLSYEHYEHNVSLVSDSVFDALLNILRDVMPKSECLVSNGWGYVSKCEDYKHTITLNDWSLTKLKIDEYKDSSDIPFSEGEEKEAVISPKYDGGSIVLYYIKGLFYKAVTRGNKEGKGIDVSANLKHIIPLCIPDNSPSVIVRGEVVLSYASYEEIGNENKHIRNKASGLSRSKHSTKEEIQHLKLICYSIIKCKKELKSKVEMLEQLTSWGFLTSSSLHINRRTFLAQMKETPNYFENLRKLVTKAQSDEVRYPTDGLVFTSMDVYKNNTGEYQETSMALKFTDEIAVTEVLNIEWSLSRLGNMKPVLIIQPVNLAGATLSRATANNHTWLIEHSAGIGAIVEVARSNEVIPNHRKTLSGSLVFNVPIVCPECKSFLIKKGKELCCNNAECPAKDQGRVLLMFEKLKPKGIGCIAIQEFFAKGNLICLSELKESLEDGRYVETIMGFAPSLKKKFFIMMDTLLTYEPTIPEILLFSSIPSFGEKNSEALGEVIDSKDFRKFLLGKEPPDEWATACSSTPAWEGLIKNRVNISEVWEFFNYRLTEIEKIPVPEKTYKVCITGNTSIPRSQWYIKYKPAGVIKSSKVSKNTDYLVCDKISSTSKFKDAERLGIPIMTEDDFLREVLGFED